MKLIGAHFSAGGGIQNVPLLAHQAGANAFALFTRNQRSWRSAPLADETVAAFKENCRAAGFGPDAIVPHDSYLINLGAPDPEILRKSREAFLDELRRCVQLGIRMLNFHPGAHKGEMTDDECLDQISREINGALAEVPGVTAVVECTAGQGSNVGHRMEQLALLIRKIDEPGRVGVCLDTCHLFAAGYDLRSREDYARTMEQFERVVGMEFLRAMHLNDSMRELASRKDRHANLGEGQIGWEPFGWIMEDPRTDGLPLILETPGPEPWPREIARLREMSG